MNDHSGDFLARRRVPLNGAEPAAVIEQTAKCLVVYPGLRDRGGIGASGSGGGRQVREKFLSVRGLPADGADLLAAALPKADRAVVGSGDNAAAVLGERDFVDRGAMSGKGELCLAALQ